MARIGLRVNGQLRLRGTQRAKLHSMCCFHSPCTQHAHLGMGRTGHASTIRGMPSSRGSFMRCLKHSMPIMPRPMLSCRSFLLPSAHLPSSTCHCQVRRAYLPRFTSCCTSDILHCIRVAWTGRLRAQAQYGKHWYGSAQTPAGLQTRDLAGTSAKALGCATST